MKRRLYLEIVGKQPPPNAYQTNLKKLAIDLDLKKAFHNGYIEVHSNPPLKGANPLFDEYFNLLAPGDELRFKPPGIANDDDLRSSESHKLGRIFARAYLSEHHKYKWFVHISNLIRKPIGQWKAALLKRGNTPDWLVTKSGSAALAEAKGTHANVTQKSSVLNSWRRQSTNVRIEKGGGTYKLKSWIVATRWVTSEQLNILPKMYVEDPVLDTGNELTSNDLALIELESACLHTMQNLERIQSRRLAVRLEAQLLKKDMPKIKIPLWRCANPALSHLRFVGTPMMIPHMETELWFLLTQLFYWPDWSIKSLFSAGDALRFLSPEAYFDGVEFSVIESLLKDQIPESLDESTATSALPDDTSLLSDGSLIAPMDSMRPLEIIEV